MSRLERNCIVSECLGRVWAREMCRKHYYRWHKHGDPAIARFVPAPAGAPSLFIEQAAMATTDDCVFWPYAKNNQGYGQINVPGTNLKRLAHREVCERVHGPPPTLAHVAAHSCGNGHLGCVNGRHLRWATNAENVEDMIGHGRSTRGERSSAAKLTAEQAKEIYCRAASGENQRLLGLEFGITQTAVSRIKRGSNWGWLTADLIGVAPEKLGSAA